MYGKKGGLCYTSGLEEGRDKPTKKKERKRGGGGETGTYSKRIGGAFIRKTLELGEEERNAPVEKKDCGDSHIRAQPARRMKGKGVNHCTHASEEGSQCGVGQVGQQNEREEGNPN